MLKRISWGWFSKIEMVVNFFLSLNDLLSTCVSINFLVNYSPSSCSSLVTILLRHLTYLYWSICLSFSTYWTWVNSVYLFRIFHSFINATYSTSNIFHSFVRFMSTVYIIFIFLLWICSTHGTLLLLLLY